MESQGCAHFSQGTRGNSMTHKGKAPPNKRATAKNSGGRPARPMPDLIPDTPENVALAAMQGPPKKRWRYLKENQG